MSSELSPQEKRLFDYFNEMEPCTDVDIRAVYAYVFELAPPTSLRRAQQRLGACTSRLNSKLTDTRIVPGELKRTYRLVVDQNK